jgi:hypothetical protein
MFDHDDDEGVGGIVPELLVDDLNRNDAGYILEVTTDGAGGDNVIVTTGQFDEETRYAEIDFGNVDNINDAVGKNYSNENCVSLTGENGKTLTVISEGGLHIVHDSVEDEAETFDNKDELASAIEGWVANNGKLDEGSI